MLRKRRLSSVPAAVAIMVALAAMPAVAEHVNERIVLVSGPEWVRGDEQACFVLSSADRLGSASVRVSVRFDGAVPGGHVIVDGEPGPTLVRREEDAWFRVSGGGVHRVQLDLVEGATLAWFSVSAEDGGITQVACDPAASRADRWPRQPGRADTRRVAWGLESNTRLRGRQALTIPAGTAMEIALDQSIRSDHARVGDRVSAHVVRDVSVRGWTAIEAGSRVEGRVVEVRGHDGDMRSELRLAFDEVRHPDGATDRIDASVTRIGLRSTGRANGLIAPPTIAGALVVGADDADASILAVVGGSIAARPGERILVPYGTLLTLRFDSAAHVGW